MTYLHKLASRISRLRTALPLLILSAVACTKGEKVEFLGPNPNIPSPKVQSLRIEPKVGSAQVGTTLRFTATGYSATGFPVPVSIDWVAQGGSISANGDYTATTAGQFSVLARAREDAAVMDSASVGVWNSQTDQIALIVSPDSALLGAGDSLDFTAAVLLVNGTAAGTADVMWTADGGSITANGRFKASQSGTFTVSAVKANGLRGQAKVFAGAAVRTLQRVALNPKTATLAPGAALSFAATGYYSSGPSGPADVAWSAEGGAINSNGVYTAAGQAGNYYVVAQNAQGTVADTAVVTVSGATVVGLSIAPKTISLQPSATATFSSLARMSDGSFKTIGVNYQATGGTIGSNGAYVAGTAPGTYRAIVTAPGVAGADTATITVAQPVATLTGILLNPATASLAAGATRQFAVTGVWSDGSALSPAVSWTATGGSVTSTGSYTAGPTPGTFRVIALTANGKADTSQVTVLPAVLNSLNLTPATGSLVVGQTLQLGVAGTWSNGSTTAPAVTWNATGGTVTNGGRFTAGASAGTYRVIATQQGGTLADTSLITISLAAPVLNSIVLSPGSVVLPQAGIQQFTAVGLWSDGSSSTPALTWTATGGTVTNSGRYTAGGTAGTYRVIAAGGGKADTSVVTVSAPAPTLTSLSISPNTLATVTGASQQFTASALWSNGGTTLPGITWTATGGSVSGNGLYTAGPNPGSFRVIASGSGKADTTPVTLTAPVGPVVSSFAVTPNSVSVAAGGTYQFHAATTWSDGVWHPATVAFSATGGTVTMDGLYTAGVVAGAFAVIGVCSCGVADTSMVMVTVSATPTLTSLQLSPASFTLAPGAGQQLGLSYTWSNGSTTAPVVQYTATGGSVSGNALYTAPATAGNYQIVVSHVGGVKKDTSFVTVTGAASPPPPPPPPTPPPPPVGGLYPNRPSNFSTIVTDYAMDAMPPGGTWADRSIGDGSGWGIVGNPTRVLDAGDPISPSYVMQWTYPAGQGTPTTSFSAGKIYHTVPSTVKEFYIAFSVWHDANFEWNAVSNKLVMLFGENTDIAFQSKHNNTYWNIIDQKNDVSYDPNVSPGTNPTGRWVKVEYQFRLGAGGYLKMWTDGNMVHNRTGTNFQNTANELALDGTWGGGNGPSTRTSTRRIGHILIAHP